MLDPDAIEHLPDSVVALFLDLDTVMRSLAAEGVSGLTRTDAGAVRAAIAAAAATMRPDIEQAIVETMTEAARSSLLDDEARYAAARAAGLLAPYAPLADSIATRNIMQRGIASVVGEMNLVRTAAMNAVSAEFTAALDAAMLAVASGAESPDAAIRTAVNRIATTDTRVVYVAASGRRVEQSIYGSVRRAVMTGANQTALRVQESRLIEVGARYVEVTAHMGARPEHAEWQGQVYRFDELAAATGYGTGEGLGGWNCRHSFYPYFPEINEPTFDDERPTTAENERNYALSQRQRLSERNVRKYASRAKIRRAGGDEEGAKRDDALARKWRAEAYTAAKARGGFSQPSRESLYPGE